MTPNQIREARLRLGLNRAEMGLMLDAGRRDLSHYEAPVGAATHREPPARVVRLLDAYLSGYRPADWPRK